LQRLRPTVVDMEVMVDTAEAMEAMAVMVDTVVRGKLRLMLLLPLRLMLLLLPHLRLMLKLTGRIMPSLLF
jgi:hypothetical protein